MKNLQELIQFKLASCRCDTTYLELNIYYSIKNLYKIIKNKLAL